MMFIPAPFWASAAAADPCVVVLLDHADAVPLVNRAPYPITTASNYAVDTTIKQFGVGSLKSNGGLGQHIVNLTGQPGGGLSLTNGDLTIEHRFRRAGGSGTPGIDLWHYYVFLELGSGGWVQFSIFSSTGGSGSHQGFRVELQDGTNYDELIAQEFPLTDSEFHACSMSISSNVARIFLDGALLGSKTLAYSVSGQRLTRIFYGDVADTERVDETRVMLNRAAYTAAYTPAATAFLTTSCDDVGTVGACIWDRSNQTGFWARTNDNLTASVVSGIGVRSIYTTVGRSTGKYYFEQVNVSGGAFGTLVRDDFGLGSVRPAGTGDSIATTPGSAYRRGGALIKNSTDIGAVTAVAAGDVVGVAADLDAGTVAYYLNNALQGTVTGMTTGTTYYPGCSSESGSDRTVDLHAKTSSFTYTPPTGFAAWGA